MGLFAAGQVVVLPFPYSDLTGNKYRPVILIAPAGHDDWVSCQITSNPYSDRFSIPIMSSSFASGGLHHTSYARPSKLFTASEDLIVGLSGTLREEVLQEVRKAAVAVIRAR